MVRKLNIWRLRRRYHKVLANRPADAREWDSYCMELQYIRSQLYRLGVEANV